ncbi:MAG: bifunctional folylpolyglutamate synthase/dihydrofolate synthase [Prolixibacteraceae bacterium]|nr:bifunctional folylpolyglutamate synthase/dihydrofolate synthase [Prolixibacteraceae bacterium]
MNYKRAIEYLIEQLPMFQRVGSAAYKDNLDNTIYLDNLYNNPHHSFKTIHIGGTNGKGSVSHMLASVLQSAGYKVGLFTSPHLKDFRERIRVNGRMISKKAVTDFVNNFLKTNNELKLSFFELSVSLAFNYFREKEIDIAVIEVGLGGRLDCTNIITPVVSVITNISYDHVNILGDTLQKIATEKAGIIKKNIPVIIGESQTETDSIFLEKAKKMNSPIVFSDKKYKIENTGQASYLAINENTSEEYKLGLNGIYQQKNLATVLSSVDILNSSGIKIKKEALLNGLKNVVENTGLQGRWQKINDHPLIICDTGHNEGGIKYITKQLEMEKYDKLHIVFGMVSDKDITKVLSMLPEKAIYYFCKASVERALDENILKEKALVYRLSGEAYSTVKDALEAAKNNSSENDMIFVGGSTFVVAEVV